MFCYSFALQLISDTKSDKHVLGCYAVQPVDALSVYVSRLLHSRMQVLLLPHRHICGVFLFLAVPNFHKRGT